MGKVLSSSMRAVSPGMLVILLAVPLALMSHYVHTMLPGDPERAVQWIGVIFLAVIVLTLAFHLILHRRALNPPVLGLLALTSLGMLLVAAYLYWVSLYVIFPADILIWAESPFVMDVLKLRLGYPIYTAEANNESFSYTPGAQLLTHVVTWLLGGTTSLAIWRVIQVSCVLCAAIAAFFCCRELVKLSYPVGALRHANRWHALWLPGLFLVATNSLTNPFVHNLHNDALALFVSTLAYWLLLKYISSRSTFVLALMALVPAGGFFVKQNLAIWLPIYCIYLVLFDLPRRVLRLLSFGVFAIGGIGLVIGSCYLLWGEHFVYWVFNFGKHPVSILRSLEHVLDAWAYFVIGLVGGLLLLRHRVSLQLLGAWLVWLGLMLVETWTSGIGWTRHHLGPGSVIAAIWFFSSLPRLWTMANIVAREKSTLDIWVNTGILVAVVSLLFSGLGVIRIPVKHFSNDAYRYVEEIEKEFDGQNAELILLDVGSWMYSRQAVVMKDRAVSIWDRAYNGTGDFSAMIRRLRKKHYTKILVRSFDSPKFVYENALWSKPSGIRQALLENYQLVGKIQRVEKKTHEYVPPMFFEEISIFVPNPS
jgi:hypothetical protein